MNAAAEQEKTEVVSEGPGRSLKRLREQKGLELAQVANLLHLSVSKLQALEADHYDQLNGPVFVQGYLRNYARLLEIPVEPLLEAYRAHRPAEERPLELRIPQVKHEVHSSHLLVRLITWIIVLGLVALVVVWWRGYIQWPMGAGRGLEENRAELSAETAGQEFTPADGGFQQLSQLPTLVEQGEQSLPLPPGEKTPPAGPAENGISAEATEKVDPVAAAEPEQDATSGESAASTTGATIEQPIQAPDKAAVTAIEVIYDGDSWTEIRDASGGFKILGVMRKGERRTLAGTPPYRVVLGNASVVRINVAGRPYDFSEFVRGNVARFELQPEKLTGIRQ